MFAGKMKLNENSEHAVYGFFGALHSVYILREGKCRARPVSQSNLYNFVSSQMQVFIWRSADNESAKKERVSLENKSTLRRANSALIRISSSSNTPPA